MSEQVTLQLEVEKRDKDFVAALSEREQSLRSKAPLDRARAASGLRKLDLNVDSLRRALVVVTLQLQLEFIYSALEEEAAEVVEGGSFRDREIELFVKEFGSLDARLDQLAQAVANDEAVVIDDEYLAVLATDIPDLKVSLTYPLRAAPSPANVSLPWHGAPA